MKKIILSLIIILGVFQIDAQTYCSSIADSTNYVDITSVKSTSGIININNSTALNNLLGSQDMANTTTSKVGRYSDFTNTKVSVPTIGRNGSLYLNIKRSKSAANAYSRFAVYVDWNQDGDFVDTNEKFILTNTASYLSDSTDIIVQAPSNATYGKTRMRIVARMESTMANYSSCGNLPSNEGETEDYNIIVAQCTGDYYGWNYNHTIIQRNNSTTTSPCNGYLVIDSAIPNKSYIVEYYIGSTTYSKVITALSNGTLKIEGLCNDSLTNITILDECQLTQVNGSSNLNTCVSKNISVSKQFSGTIGNPLTIIANISPFDSFATYQWKKDGVILPNNTTSYIYKSATTYSDTGIYCVQVTFSNGCVKDTCVRVSVNPCTNIIASLNNYFDGTYNSMLALNITSNIIDSVTYQWSKDGTNISGATNSFYIDSNVTNTDIGLYCVHVTYPNGCVKDTCVFISVINPCAGKYINLSLIKHVFPVFDSLKSNIPANDSALSYSWKKNGISIPGANGPKVAAIYNGTYCLTVNYKNGCIKDTCWVIDSSIYDPCSGRTLNISKNFNGVYGSSLYINSTISPYDSLATYQWKKKGVVISGATYSYYLDSNITASDTGLYCLTVTFSNGCVKDACTNVQFSNCTTKYHQTDHVMCAGQSYMFNNQNLTTAGLYFDTLKTSNGCDSIVSLSLSVNNLYLTDSTSSTLKYLFSHITGNVSSYQWKKNGINITGATAPNLTFNKNDTGQYCVVVNFLSGCSLEKCITISNGPNSISCSNYKYYTVSINGNSVHFSPLNVPSPYTTTYNWTFSNGATSTLKNPTLTFANGSYVGYMVYCIKDSMNNTICCDTFSKSFVVNNTSPIPCNVNANFVWNTTSSNGIQFIDSTTPQTGQMYTYLWSFGDGTTSTLKNPYKTYAVNGTKTVCLLVRRWLNNNNMYCEDTTCKTINITNANTCNNLSVYFSSNQNATTVYFTNQTQANGLTVTNYLWTFGDGTTSTASNPTKSYNNTGSYVVTLTVTAYDSSSQTSCTKYYSKYIYFNSNPCYYYKAYSSYTKNYLTVNFNNYSGNPTNSTQTYFWNFGNGTTSTLKNPSITYTNPGIYRVVQKVTTQFNGYSCTDSIVKIIQVNSSNPCKDTGFVNTVGNNNCGTYNSPICGCDGITYQNYCYGNMNGVKQYTQGPCPNDTNYIKLCGYIYHDENSNCTKDSTEKGIAYRRVKINTTPARYAYTNSLGYYSIYVPRGNYTITQMMDTFYNPKYYQKCPTGSIAVNAVSGTQVYCNNNFYDTTVYQCRDLKTSIHRIANITPGFTSMKRISYTNFSSTSVSNVVLKYKYSSVLSIKAGTSTPYTMLNNIITWNLGTLASYATGNKYANFNTPTTGVSIGSLHYDTAWIEPADTNDCNLTNNIAIYTDTCTSSWDPNDKAVSPNGNILPEEKELEFLVRFQNTGNAPAHNVVIKDPIDASIDVSSIAMLDASHECTMHLRDDNMLQFEFANIMLPDSGTDYDKSQGYVSFKARLRDNLSLGTKINNTAYIYFDFNEAVITNTTINTIYKKSTSAVYPVLNQEAEIKLYPNPVQNSQTTLEILTKTPKKVSYNIIDISGRIIETSTQTQATSDFKKTLMLDAYGSGVYFIEIYLDGMSSKLIKVVK